jgi:signal transduction histidine kinase
VDKKIGERLLDSRLLLLAGFGSLLFLPMLAFYWSGVESRRASAEIHVAQANYFAINQLLNELKLDVLNGGTYLRNFILESDEDAAELHRDGVRRSRSNALSVLAAKQLQQSGDVYRGFVTAYDDYWKTVEPVLEWKFAKRKTDGYQFLRDQAFARRTAILELAAQIGNWNEQQLAKSEVLIEKTLAGVERSQRETMAAFLLVGVALASLLYWRITSLERQASDRLELAELAREEARGLSARLLAVQEEERKAISRELHDGVAQNLSALKLGVEELARQIPGEQRANLGALSALAEETLKMTRNLSLLLRPSMLDDLGLVPALRWLARECQRRNGVQVEVEALDELDGLSEDARICVFRVVQEALSNAVRHAAARVMKIRAGIDGGRLLVSIQDDGKSFDVEKEKGMGILGMTERVEKLGGRFQIVSKAGVGTVVMAELP